MEEENGIKYSCYGRPNICMRCKVEQSEEEFHAGNFCSQCAPKVNKMWAELRLSHEKKMQECYDFESGKDLEK